MRKCLWGHKYKPATFLYWAKIEGVWTHRTEEAKFCGRCGKFVVPNSKFPENGSAIPTAERKKK